MLLSEINPSENLKVLVVGPAGSRKTCFAAGFPGPIDYFDFDGKVDSAAALYANEPERLKQITVHNCSTYLDSKESMIDKMMHALNKEIIPRIKEGKGPRTIVIDSLTTFSTALLSHIMITNPGIKGRETAQGKQPDKPHYGILRREFERLIPGILGLPCNVVMLAHIETDKSELTGEILRIPMLDGSFGEELPIYFKEVYRSYVKDGKGLAQTQSDMYYTFCRSQVPGLPNPIELNYANLIKKYK